MARTSVAREIYGPDKRCSSAGWYVISIRSGITRYSSLPTPASGTVIEQDIVPGDTGAFDFLRKGLR